MKTQILLITLAILGLIFLIKSDNSSSIDRFQISSKPQEYMNDVFVTTYTETGALKYQLTADDWAYRPETQSSFITTPHLTSYRPDGTRWTIDAKKGKTQQPTLGTIEQIELLENVVIQRPESPLSVPVKLETETLFYQLKKQCAESDAFITLTKPGLKITGVGLRALLEQSSVELLHNVKTYYTSK